MMEAVAEARKEQEVDISAFRNDLWKRSINISNDALPELYLRRFTIISSMK